MAYGESSKNNTFGWIWFVIVPIVILVAGAIVVNRQRAGQPAAVPAASVGESLGPGDEGRLEGIGGNVVAVATGKSALKNLTDAEANGVDLGNRQAIVDRRALPVPQGTLVRIIETDPDGFKVQILEGDLRGFSGWVPREYVKPL